MKASTCSRRIADGPVRVPRSARKSAGREPRPQRGPIWYHAARWLGTGIRRTSLGPPSGKY